MAKGKKKRGHASAAARAAAKSRPGEPKKPPAQATERPAQAKKPAAEPERPGLSPRVLLAAVLVLVAAGVIGVLAFGTGGGSDEEEAADTAGLRVPWVDPDGPSPIIGSVDINPAEALSHRG